MIDDKYILTDEERQPCEVWCRVMGYLRPQSQYNKGKQAEFNERIWFTETKATKKYEVKNEAESTTTEIPY